MNKIKNIIGSLFRDIIVMSQDYVYWKYDQGTFIYKNPFNFNMNIGRYKFLKEDKFNEVYY